MKSENVYALVNPTNSLRITLSLLEQNKIKTDIKLTATAHGQSIKTYSELHPEIDASYLMTSQPTLLFHGRQWLKNRRVLDAINRLNIKDVPLQHIEMILPSTSDGKKHRTTFARINMHTPMFKKMVAEGKIPYRRLVKIHKDFIDELKKNTSKAIYKHLKMSLMVMTDVNPGKQEMFSKDFVIGLRQPFMHKVFTTQALWRCTDYEVF